MRALVIIVAALAGSMVVPIGAWGLPVEVQTFDSSPPDWTGLNNTAVSNNYGFSNTNHTGRTPEGEAGGTIYRSALRSYYADTDLSGFFTLDDPFMASGELDITSTSGFNNTVRIGHFDHTTMASSMNYAGLDILEPGATFRFRAEIALANGTSLFGNMVDSGQFPANGDYLFEYSYDPVGGTGNGQLLVRILNSSDTVIGTSTLNLTAGDRAIGAVFRAFGLGSGGDAEQPTNQVNLFIDNLTYTSLFVPPTLAPEPASIVLFGGVILSLVGWTWYRRRASRI